MKPAPEKDRRERLVLDFYLERDPRLAVSVHDLYSGGISEQDVQRSVRKGTLVPVGAEKVFLTEKGLKGLRTYRAYQSMSTPESRTVRLAQQGDESAFERLYHKYNRRIYADYLRRTKSIEDAEDLTQGAFIQLYSKIGTFRGESTFGTWLHRLAINLYLMSIRKKAVQTVPIEELVSDITHNPKHDGNGRMTEIRDRTDFKAGFDAKADLESVIDNLPPGYKTVFVLHDIQGYEHNEIAGIMGCSVGNSKSQLFNARKRLGELLHAGRNGPDSRQEEQNIRHTQRVVEYFSGRGEGYTAGLGELYNLGLAYPEVKSLLKRGVIKSVSKGRYQLGETCQAAKMQALQSAEQQKAFSAAA